MIIPLSKNGYECGLLRETLEKVAEADIRSAHGEQIARPAGIGKISPDIYRETVEWMEHIANPNLLVNKP
jgi:hypothetical protein